MSIDLEVWEPFRSAYAAGDADAFLALHAPDLIRAGGPGGEVLDLEGYGKQIGDFFALVAERGDRAAIDLRFTERLSSGDLASERGVTRITMSLTDGTQRVSYARFHVLLRRTGGRWRIVADYDSPAEGSAEAYAAARP